jgi:YYY domain-containing protein
VALPLTAHMFSERAGHGYVFGKIVALLLVTYCAWVLGHAGVAYGTAVRIALAAFVGLNAILAWSGRAQLGAWLRGAGLRTILLHDAFWTAGFLFFAWQRALAPEIFGAEKYMDFAFFNTLLRTDVMPPQDMWMAGKPFNYYYFGYLTFANLARLTPVPSQVAYNLCVVTAGGLAFAHLAAIGWTLTRRIAFAWLTAVTGMVLGNLDGFLQLIEKHGLTQFDYWRSSRVVASGDTINEFPFFTVIHGDLHPHFIVLPVGLLLLALLLDPAGIAARVRRTADGAATTFRDLWAYAVVGFVLSTMVVISTWELPVGAMMTFLLLGRDLPLLSTARLRVALLVVAMLVAGYVLYAPFYLHFTAPTATPGPNDVCVGSACIKIARTSLAEFMIVFGALLAPPMLFLALRLGPSLSLSAEQRQFAVAAGLLVIVLAYLAGNAVIPVVGLFGLAALSAVFRTSDSGERAVLLLLVGASVALLACEFVYVKDAYGDRLYRMNTVFKLYFQSWILLAIAAPWCLTRLLDRRRVMPAVRRVAAAVGGGLLLASCAYPVGITATRLTHRYAPMTLDGTEYLSREHPDDFAAIAWMRDNVRDLPVVVEATGNPYSYYARFSSNTGLPTILGWANHEGLWRSHENEVQQRANQVARIYNAPTLDEVRSLLDSYGVRYIVVGELERKDYQAAGLQKFQQLKVAFSQGGTTVYER